MMQQHQEEYILSHTAVGPDYYTNPQPYPPPPPQTNHDGPNSGFGNGITPRTQKSWRWLRINLTIANVTTWGMFVLGGIIMAFASLAITELKHDEQDDTCARNFIYDADSFPQGTTVFDRNAPGQYHSDCARLVQWGYVVIVAGSFSVARNVMLGLPTGSPTVWTIKRSPGPAWTYSIRTLFSLVPAVLYLVSAVLLGTNRLITGPPADEAYQIMYKVCLALLAIGCAASTQQTLATGIAAWLAR